MVNPFKNHGLIDPNFMTYGREVASGNGKTDGERCGALDVIAMGIAHAEDDKQQQEAEEELHAEALQRVKVVVHGGHAQVAAELFRSERLKTKNTSPQNPRTNKFNKEKTQPARHVCRDGCIRCEYNWKASSLKKA
jgi:hypothetical protein